MSFPPPPTRSWARALLRDLAAVAAAWVLSLGFDALLHGALLARLYLQASPFLLAPEAAFRRIPIGYAAFFVLTVALYWLLRRLDVRGMRAGFWYGCATGLVLWGTFAAGLYSISTATPSLLLAWWLGQALELGLAGAVLGAAASGVTLKRIWSVVIVAIIGLMAGAILLQSMGFVPVIKRVP